MSDVNKAIVKTTQKILTEMGVTIKTTQVYEMYSKLSGYKNWNEAKPADVDFSAAIEGFTSDAQPGTDPEFLRALEQTLLEEYGELPEPTVNLTPKQAAKFREARIQILDTRTTIHGAFMMIQTQRDDSTVQYALMHDPLIAHKIEPMVDDIKDETKVTKPNEIKAFRIKADDRRLTPNYLPTKNLTLEYWQGWVGGFLEIAHRFSNGDILVVCEDGIRNAKSKPNEYGYFMVAGNPQPLVGDAFIVSEHKGEFASAKANLKDLRKMVTFLDRKGYDAQMKLYNKPVELMMGDRIAMSKLTKKLR